MLLEKPLADASLAKVIAARAGTHLLTTMRTANGAPEWADLRTGEKASPGEWRRKSLVTRPGRNIVLIIANGFSTEIGETVGDFRSLDSDFTIVVSVLILGASPGGTPPATLGPLAAWAADPSIRVWYLAHEDNLRKPISDHARFQFLEGLLQLLGSMDDDRAGRTGLWPDPSEAAFHSTAEVEVGAAGATRPGPFAVPGLVFWGRSLAEYPSMVRALALDLLKNQMFRAGRETEERLVRDAPATLINRLGNTDIPYAGGASAQTAARFSQRLRPIPDVTSGWMCPLLRSVARRAGAEFLRQAERDVRAYYDALVEELHSVSAEVRKQGVSAVAQARNEIRGQVEQCEDEDLGRLALLLHAFFPAFDALSQKHGLHAKTACLPAHSPPWADFRAQAIGEAESAFLGNIEALPTIRTAIIGGVAALALLGFGAWVWMRGLPIQLTWISVGVGVLGPAIWLAVTWLTSRRITRAVDEHLRRSLQGLRGAFVEKLEWAIRAAHRSAEVETVAYARSLGRRLRRSFDDFLGDWRIVENEGAPTDTALGVAAEVWPADELEDVRSELARTAAILKRGVLEKSGGFEAADELRELVASLSVRAQMAACRRPVPYHQSLEGDLRDLSGSRKLPALMARLDDGVLQSRLHHVFFIPDSYPEDLDGKLVANSRTVDIPSTVIRTAISGPAVWLACRGLSEEERVRSFATTRYGG
jgi:hypothetical protein